ncbi:MAG: winged helix-turn-helix transcriptional regulator [Euryarchaeota archaeon]|nr:winged helix-turn-helix transcriptional regulator [Euryarchaeota archaeon]
MLRVLEDGKAHTFSRLSRVLGTSYSTVTSNCDFLRMLGLVEIASIAKQDSASGRSYSHVRITRKGRAWLDELADK